MFLEDSGRYWKSTFMWIFLFFVFLFYFLFLGLYILFLFGMVGSHMEFVIQLMDL